MNNSSFWGEPLVCYMERRFSYPVQLCFFSVWECLCIPFSEITKGLFELCLRFCKAGSPQSRPLPGWTGRDCEAVQLITRSWFWRLVIGVFFPSFKTLGILRRSAKKCASSCGCGCFGNTNAVPTLRARKICWGGEPGSTFNLTSEGVRCWPCGLWL